MPARLVGVTASMETRLFRVELSAHETDSPCDVTYSEPNYVIAIQRQRLQNFSTGRFAASGSKAEFQNIGRLLVLPPNTPLQIRAEGGVSESMRFSFTPAIFKQLTGLDQLVDDASLHACLDIKCPRISRMLAQLANEAERPEMNATTLVDALGTAVVIELTRYLKAQRRDGTLSRGGLARRAFRQIVDFVNDREGDASIADLAQLTGYSERHLSRAFKETTGQTLHEFISEVRLKRAIELLSDTELMVKDVAQRLGFGSSGSFCTAFANETGESPGEFRKRQAPSPGRDAPNSVQDAASPLHSRGRRDMPNCLARPYL